MTRALSLLQARAQAQAEQLQRERLAGDKKSLGQDASSENAAYKLLVRAAPAFFSAAFPAATLHYPENSPACPCSPCHKPRYSLPSSPRQPNPSPPLLRWH